MTLKTILKISIVFTFIVILMGAYTRLADAGLGCPDWPGCYGQLKVPSGEHELAKAEQHFPGLEVEPKKAWLEMIHRYLAGTLGLMVFGILIYCLRTKDTPKKLPIVISVLIIFQALLGMWTVTMMLMPIVVMSHLLGGFTLIALLFVMYLRVKPLRVEGGDRFARGFKSLALIALLALIGQIMLGGWTSSNYAALTCTTLPICQGDWWNNLNIAKAFSPFQGDHISFEYGVLDHYTRMTIHVAHRIWAIVTSLLILWLGLRLLKSHSSIIKHGAGVMLALLVLQVLLGVSNIEFLLPLPVAVAHNGGAALLLLSVVYLNYAIRKRA
ncbi:cytochrome B [Shewanella sp. OPT22]|nr:cytochrome B [Shewanella sp. OPT22]